MSIKNLEKKHWLGADRKYLCFSCCEPTKEKVAKEKKKVTCQNCKKILAK